MKRLAMLATLAALALVVGTSAVMADCSGYGCANEDPTVSTPPQDGCGTNGCAVPFQTASPCPTPHRIQKRRNPRKRSPHQP